MATYLIYYGNDQGEGNFYISVSDSKITKKYLLNRMKTLQEEYGYKKDLLVKNIMRLYD